MAAQNYETGFQNHYAGRFKNITKDSTYEDIRELYDNWAKDFEQESAAAGSRYRKPLAECLDVTVKEVFPDIPNDQLKILDAGAGTGLTGTELHKLGYTDIHALDISQEMLNVAKEKGVPYKRFVCTPLTEKRIPEFETGEFDAVIAAGVLVKAHVRPAAFVKKLGWWPRLLLLRPNEADDYQPKMTELEKAGVWENLCKKEIPYWSREDMQNHGPGFVYKVLKK